MAAYFQLVDKETSEPVNLADVNNELWVLFGEKPCDDWCCGWYSVIGFGISIGKCTLVSLSGLEKYIEYYFKDPTLNAGFPFQENRYKDMLLIAKYLHEKYESRAWC